MRNPRYLNAEDETTLQQTEIAVDLALLDSKSELCVLRGDTVDNPKYAGKRVFSTGINLTHIYNGKISYIWYVTREMGFVNKMMRGLARPDADPDEVYGGTTEKPWIAGVEHFAIGGGCQYLLTMQGRHHPGRRQYAHVALHRRQDFPPGHPVRPQARLRHARRPHDL
jgi:thioesterase DpgC